MNKSSSVPGDYGVMERRSGMPRTMAVFCPLKPLMWHPLCSWGVQRTHVGRRLSSGELLILPSRYCWSELPEGCSVALCWCGCRESSSQLGVGSPASWARAELLNPLETGFSWEEAACSAGAVGRLDAHSCLLSGERHDFSVVANRQMLYPKLTQGQGFSSGKAAVCLSPAPQVYWLAWLWAPRTGQGPPGFICVSVFWHTRGAQHRFLSCQSVFLTWAGEC